MAEIVKVWNEDEPVLAGEFIGGFAIPTRLTTNAELDDGSKVTVDIVVEGGRAHVEQVTVRAEIVSSTTLRNVPLRKVTAAGLGQAVRLMRARRDGTIQLVQVDKRHRDEARLKIAQVVRYLESRTVQVKTSSTQPRTSPGEEVTG